MERTVDERLRDVFSSVFGMNASDISAGTSPGAIDAWDSVGHLNLILALEAEFGIEFDAEEIPELISFGVILARLDSTAGA